MVNLLDLTGKAYLVTGASSGIGRAVAILLSQLGARVILSARSSSRLEHTLSLMENRDEHLISEFDFYGGLEKIDNWMHGLSSRFQKLDGVVHCVGIYEPAVLKTLTDERIMDSLNVNLASVLRIAICFRKKSISKAGSIKSIVLLSSISGIAGGAGLSLYSATKGGIISLTKSIALELIRDGIRVNCISPAFVKTKMTEDFFAKLSQNQLLEIEKTHPMGFGHPEDIANSVAFLLSDAARWITGTNLIVDGGYSAQ